MNTGINILCYKSKTLANGEHPLMFRVCKDGKKKYVSLGVSVAPQYWDFQKNKPKRNCPNKIMIEKLIAQKSRELSDLVLELEADSKDGLLDISDYTPDPTMTRGINWLQYHQYRHLEYCQGFNDFIRTSNGRTFQNRKLTFPHGSIVYSQEIKDVFSANVSI